MSINRQNAYSKEERTYAMLCHIVAFGGFFVPIVGNIVLPLVIWMIKKDNMPLVDDQGKESVNFQISISIYVLISSLLSTVFVGIPFLIAIIIFDIIQIIVAGMAANDGRAYRYPLCMRFVK